MINYYNAYNENNTIACRNNGTEVEAHGFGFYSGKAPTVKIICSVNGTTLRSVEKSTSTVYEIICDGEVYNRTTNRREAEALYLDFADLTRGKFNKIKNAA